MDIYLRNIRMELLNNYIHLDKLEDRTGIFDHVDDFVNVSRDNETVQHLILRLTDITDPDAHRYAIWDKIAEGIGNLQALREIVFVDVRSDDGEEDPLAPDWNVLAFILRRLRRGIDLRMCDHAHNLWDTDALPAFTGVIHGQAMITGFSTGAGFPFLCLDMLCSALLTLPALENVSFEQLAGEGPEEGQSLESMIKLLQSPTLRGVTFECVDFTNTLCKAVAKALKERSEITDLHFIGCSFPEGGGAVIARALTTNTTLEILEVDAGNNEAFYEALSAALLSNSTLQYLECSTPDSSGSCSWLSPLFLALEVNNGLEELSIRGIHLIDEKLSTAMRLGLGNNSTLETLKLLSIKSGDSDTCLWREALSFLPTNVALKTLHMQFEHNVMNSRVATIRMEVLAMLCENECENESLETLEMIGEYAGLKDYLECVEAIQSNTTLKKLELHEEDYFVDPDEFEELIPVLKKNYGLEYFLGLRIGAGDIGSIFDLNRAGRRYLVQDGSSISKGVDVLSRVSSDINSVFFHLLENPRLCDRSAIERARSTSPGNRSCGK
jgi:hypothetical protein